jgi:excisionase family DNA binding protein
MRVFLFVPGENMNSNTMAATLRKTRRGWETEQIPLLVSKRDAATLLSLCVRTIDNLIATKQLPCRRIGKRVLIPYSALVAFVRRDHIGTPEAQ